MTLSNWQIQTVASTQDRVEGLNLLMSGQNQHQRQQEIERLLELETQGELSLCNLLLARNLHQQTIAAMLMLVRPDQTGMIWLPAFEKKTSMLERGLLACQFLQRVQVLLKQSDCWIGQFLLEPEDRHWQSVLEANGFPGLGTMLVFEKKLQQTCLKDWENCTQERTEQWSLQTFDERLEQEFADVIFSSYESSDDFPEVSSGRSGLQALQGHRLAGRFEPENWKLLNVNGLPAGVVLTTYDPHTLGWELVYLGLKPEFRGQKWGSFLLRWLCFHACTRGGKLVTLGVDSRNCSAIWLYEKQGFKVQNRQHVHAWLPRKIK